MSEKHVWVTSTINGVPALVPERYLSHPTLGAHLKASRTGKRVVRFSEPAVSDVEAVELAVDVTEEPEIEKKED